MTNEELLAEFDTRIAAAEAQIAALKQARAVLAGGELHTTVVPASGSVLAQARQFGTSSTGRAVISCNNSLQKAKKKGNKAEIAKLTKELTGLRAKLAQEKADTLRARRQLLGQE